MAATEEQQSRRTPFSAKLPQVALDDALDPVRALAELGAPSTPHVIAQHAGTTYSSSGFRTKIAAAGYYGLIGKQGEKRALTQRGTIILSDGASSGEQVRARREAVMSTSFGPVIHSLRGRAVSDGAVTLRLQGDYGVPEASAPSIAAALIEAARQAGLIQNDRFDAVAIEEVASVIPKETAAGGNGTPRPPVVTAPREPASKPEPVIPAAEEVEKKAPFVPGVQVVVKVDASKLSPREIAELVRELQRPS